MGFLDTGYSEEAATLPVSNFKLLPEGDYKFRISEALGITFTDTGHEKLSLILSIDGQRIYSYLYAGISGKTNKPFDMLSPFCKSIGIRPSSADAKNSNYWAGLVGKSGMCHLIQEEQQGGKYEGQLANKVKYFIYPQDVSGKPAPAARPQPAASSARSKPAAPDPDLDVEPDDIPF